MGFFGGLIVIGFGVVFFIGKDYQGDIVLLVFYSGVINCYLFILWLKLCDFFFYIGVYFIFYMYVSECIVYYYFMIIML